MYVARILYPVKVLGPGKRVGIWLTGCPHGCDGCISKEFWEQKEEEKIDVYEVIRLVKKIHSGHRIDGFTISGGEPFEQYAELLLLLKELSMIAPDILVYTGYLYEELFNIYKEHFKYITVLIDGRYEKESNKSECLRGSLNQKIYYINEDYKIQYLEYIEKLKIRIQGFNTEKGIIYVGIPDADFKESLNEKMLKKGILPIKGEDNGK